MMEIPPGDGLPRKVFNHHLDRYMETGELNPDILPYMDEFQQQVVNEVKKSFNRIKAKHAREIKENSTGVEGAEESV